MSKKLKLRALGAFLLSAFLLTMPAGALFFQEGMAAPVYAEELSGESTQEEPAGDAENKEPEDGDTKEPGTEEGEEPEETDPSGEDQMEETDPSEEEPGESDPSGEESGEDQPQPEEMVCTCKEHCSSIYHYDAGCEVCRENYENCAYIDPNVSITIQVPEGWYRDKAKITVSVADLKHTGNFEIAKIEAKIGQSGSFQDITEDKCIEVSENCTVYVQVTDQNGKVYAKNKSVRCFDTTKPSLNAAVSNGLLSVEGYDSDSGIKAFYVNGYEFTEFTGNTLNIRLQQFDTGYEYFTIRALDHAGNMSEVYKTKNPYYDDDKTDNDDKGASTLPVDATPTKPASATASVTEHVKTDSEGNTTYESSKEAEKHAAMAEADEAEEAEYGALDETVKMQKGKEFYTIETASEKVFYLIIDRDGEEEVVYFLTEISENDLLNATAETSETLPKNSAALESAIPTKDTALTNNNTEPEKEMPEKEEEPDTPAEEKEDETPVKEEKQGSGFGTYLVIGILAALAIIAGYYLKVVKKKKEDFLDEDDEEDEEEFYETEDESLGDEEDDFFRMQDKEDLSEDVTESTYEEKEEE